DNILSLPLKEGRSVAGWESRSKAPINLKEIDREGEYAGLIGNQLGITPRDILSAPLYAGGEFLGIVQAINDKDDSDFKERDLDLLQIIAERIALTLRNAWILEEAVRALEETKSLNDAGMALSGSLELDELLDKILDNLKRVVEYEIGIIYLVDPKNSSISQISSRGISESAKENLHLKIGQGICGRVAETGKAIIVSDVLENTDYITLREQTRSEMAVPMEVDGSLIGVFNVESDNPNAYSKHHLELMNGFASLAAVSIERARLHHERIASRKIEHELSIARRIQMTFLPAEDPAIDGVDIAGINIPSSAVGGDYYDFIPIVENQYGIAIGDVSGKGIPASLIMAAFRASLKAEIRNNFAIRSILYKVNNLLYESIERDRFVTAVYGVFDSKSGIFTFSNAGHNQPILRRSDGQVEYLKEGGIALGVIPDSQYQERPLSLKSGDILLFYTDGVTEIIDKRGYEFDVERLLSALNESCHLSAREIIDFIVKKTDDFRSDGREIDDLTMVVVKML
ncbi:MAG: SpoIIE family protein phosphatase, partial [candidate division Zixibacteria bacterium]